ncbi:MAG: FmdB family transcriptional regulator [Actinobacteria bacterium]|nr:FmdB family transcriptional regulator [Actinomycetota bacterium]MSW31628.1 FmdB family transcriptional regulator [Actinomycetota bacterium]MSX34504.1 FmdB family transcriptional regulator [Actinomycetota bacterium]MSX95826.1 FmdB family transcriptional regulator [Actinomycetota bacterium]MSY25365.1 FmdB family transcriptional regulator [Actinomycetota bacterium]
MPTYDYQCKDCGHAFEAQQAFTDDALTECPSCGGALKKKFGSVGIAFKGSGFYKNDARGSSGSSTPPPSPSSTTPSTGSDSTKSSDSSSSSTSTSSSSSDSGSSSTPSAS